MKKVWIVLFFISLILIPLSAQCDRGIVYPASAPINYTTSPRIDSSGADKTVSYWDLPLWIKIAYISTALLSALVLIKIIPFFVVRLKGTFDNPNRIKIYESIKNNPGQTLTEISEDKKVNRGTLRYHLNTLLKSNKIFLLKKGNSFYVFHKNPLDIDGNDVWLYLKSETERKILYSVMDKPGVTNTELSAMLNMNKSNTHRLLKKYAKTGIIEFKEDGKNKRCYLTSEASDTLKKYRYEQNTT
jgi:predicted transcriptional regulator